MLQTGARYHVVARAHGKAMIMAEKKMKYMFEETIARARLKYKFRVENFCIMGNHFHLLIQPAKGENLSRIMQWILSVFAVRYNKVHGRCNAVWGGRFFSKIISGLQEVLHTMDYIDDNPVMANLSYERDQWRFGGLWHARHGWRHICDRLDHWLLLFVARHQVIMLSKE